MAAAALSDRLISLDVVRGIAVMGILLMNIVAFAMPSPAYLNPHAFGGDGPIDLAVWATNSVLADGKMRGLFALLFGASMLLVAERAEAKGESPLLVHYSRMTWLLLFGAIHAYAIWYGDILMLYAVVGMVAILFRRMETHGLVVLGLLLVIGQALFMLPAALSIWTLRDAAASPGADPETIALWTETATLFGPMQAGELARDLAVHQGSYADLLANRLGPEFWTPIRNNGFAAIETLGLMLLGMAGLKSGFLTGQWDVKRYARIAAIGYLIGLPLLIGLTLAVIRSGFEPAFLFLCDFVIKGVANLPLILAHAALVIYWTKVAAGSASVARVAAAGRAAFTNYLGTSLICTTIFYGYGFGLYAELGRAELYPVVFGVWAVMLLWSKPWLDRIRYGPFEWLWRSLARREIQPMRTG